MRCRAGWEPKRRLADDGKRREVSFGHERSGTLCFDCIKALALRGVVRGEREMSGGIGAKKEAGGFPKVVFFLVFYKHFCILEVPTSTCFQVGQLRAILAPTWRILASILAPSWPT